MGLASDEAARQLVGVLLLVGFVLQPPADVTIRLDDELLRSFSGPLAATAGTAVEIRQLPLEEVRGPAADSPGATGP